MVHAAQEKRTLMDVERTIEFILQRQAQFASDIQVIKEVIKAQQEQFGSDLNQITAVMLDVATSQQRTNEVVAVLAQRLGDISNLMEHRRSQLSRLLC